MSGFAQQQKSIETTGIAEFAGRQIPYTRAIPEDPVPDIEPIFYLRGFLAQQQDYAGIRRATAAMGIESVTMQSVIGVEETDAALSVMQQIKKDTDHEQFCLAPQSWGGNTASSLAVNRQSSDYVKSVVLIASACLTNHDLATMAVRSGHFLVKDLPRTTIEHCRDDTKDFAISSLSRIVSAVIAGKRTTSECKQAIWGNIQERLIEAREMGIGFSALQFISDRYSPPHEALAIKELFHEVRIMDADPSYDHLTVQRRPEVVAPVVVEMFTNIENHTKSSVLRAA